MYVCMYLNESMYPCCRSCDSTFGLGSLSNEDDLCWFSSSHSPEGTEDALKLGSKFPNSEASALNSVPQHLEASRLSNAGPSINDSTKKSLVMGDKISSSSASAVDHSSLDHLTFPNISDTKSVSKDDLLLKEQVCKVFMFQVNSYFLKFVFFLSCGLG